MVPAGPKLRPSSSGLLLIDPAPEHPGGAGRADFYQTHWWRVARGRGHGGEGTRKQSEPASEARKEERSLTDTETDEMEVGYL
jgi:hypothetical protein